MALTSLRDEITFVALALERRHVAKAVAIALNGSRSILHQTRTRLVTALSVVPHVAGTGIILTAAVAIAFDEGSIPHERIRARDFARLPREERFRTLANCLGSGVIVQHALSISITHAHITISIRHISRAFQIAVFPHIARRSQAEHQ